jgi:hypothetical protein
MTGFRKLRLILPTPPARSSSHPTGATSIARQMAPVPVDQALAQLARDDPAAAEDAGALYDALTWGEGAETITQHGLQGLLWYELPRKFVGGPSKLEMALALGHLLGRAGMPRYAAICGSQETADVLAAWERGDRDGFAALERAMDRSGVEPPDLPDFEWGDVMDELEASTRELVSERLELAIAAGELRPGAPGWRARQREIAGQLLIAPRADLHDQSPLAAIRAQRAQTWARRRSGAPRELLEPRLSELFDGPDIAAVRPLPALAWLLARSLEGLPLTAAGFLRPALVREAVERFGLESYGDKPRRETDVPALAELHDLIIEMRAVRKRKRELHLTRPARALVGDPAALWQAAAGGLTVGGGFAAAASELTLALLLDDRSPDDSQARLATILEEEGWREQETGLPPSRETVTAYYFAVVRRLRALGGVSGERWFERPIELSPLGRALALEALRQRATAPLRGI